MSGKYVGNRPIILKRSQWEDKSAIGGKSKIQEGKFVKK